MRPDPKVCRLFIIDGAKALSKAIHLTFGRHTPIQRCQIHKARNVIERLPKPLHASVRRTLRQAWELDDAEKAEWLLRNLARRLEQDELLLELGLTPKSGAIAIKARVMV